MNARLMPLVISIVALGALSGVLLATVGASGDGSARKAALDEADGGGVAAACIEGTVNCNDTIGIPIDDGMNMCIEGVPDCNDIIDGQPPIRSDEGIDPNECNLVHNLDACTPEQLADAGITLGPVYDIGVDFTADVTQADMDAVSEIIRSYDPGADVLILERFPPAASARVQYKEPDFCSADFCDEFCRAIVAQLEAANGVASVTCAPYTSAGPDDPDKPVSSDVPTSADDIPPDECNAVHNIDACSPEELEDLGLQPPAE